MLGHHAAQQRRGADETSDGDDADTDTDTDTVWISVHVHPDYRRRGIGSALLAELESLAQGDGKRQADTYAPAAEVTTRCMNGSTIAPNGGTKT